MTVIVREGWRREARAGPSSIPLDESLQAAKSELRAAVLRERSGMSAARRLAVARGLRDAFLELPQLRHTRCVAVYASRSTEPGTYLLRDALASRGVDVVHPVIGTTTGLRWLASGQIPHPRDARAHHDRRSPDRQVNGTRLLVPFAPVILVPALAVDTQGRRLGRGHGEYDHILRLADPATLVLAAVHDTELFDSAVEPVPEEAHDVRVDAVLTPSRIHYLTDRCSL